MGRADEVVSDLDLKVDLAIYDFHAAADQGEAPAPPNGLPATPRSPRSLKSTSRTLRRFSHRESRLDQAWSKRRGRTRPDQPEETSNPRSPPPRRSDRRLRAHRTAGRRRAGRGLEGAAPEEQRPRGGQGPSSLGRAGRGLDSDGSPKKPRPSPRCGTPTSSGSSTSIATGGDGSSRWT